MASGSECGHDSPASSSSHALLCASSVCMSTSLSSVRRGRVVSHDLVGTGSGGERVCYDGVFMGSWIGFRKMDPSRRILEASTYVSSRRGLPGWNCFPLVVRTVFEISSNQKETTGNMHAHSRAHTHVRTYSHADLLGQMVAMGVHSAVCIYVSVNSVAHYNVNVYTCTLPSGSNVTNSSSPKPTLLARLISEWGGI